MSAQADQKQGEHSWRRLGSGSERARQRSAQGPLGRSRNPLRANAARLRAEHVLPIQLSPEHPKAP